MLEPATELNEPAGDDFSHLCVIHPHMKAALDQIYRLLEYRSGVSIVSVFGPTGIGKTTLCKLLQKKILAKYATEMAANPGVIPTTSGPIREPPMETRRRFNACNCYWMRGRAGFRQRMKFIAPAGRSASTNRATSFKSCACCFTPPEQRTSGA